MGNHLGHSHGFGSDYNPSMSGWHQSGSFAGHPLWLHPHTHHQLQQYKYTAHNKTDLRRLHNLFQFRRNSPHLVSSHYFNDSEVAGVHGSHHLVSIFVEKIPVRLSDINSVPFPDVLHLYEAGLRGFGELYGKVGYFQVSEEMVGVNTEGQGKVWFHGDFKRDRPEKEPGSYTSKEGEMVADIIQMIERKTEHINEPEPLGMYLRSSNAQTFQGTLKLLHQYAQKHFITIPDLLPTIKNRFNSGHIRVSPTKHSYGTTSINRHLSASPSRPVPHVQPQLPPEAVITQVDSFVPGQQKLTLPPGVLPQNLISVVPIYAQTPIGLRQVSPARIIIRAQSPLRQHSQIRSQSPPSKIIQGHRLITTNTQLHPSQVLQKVPLNSQSVVRFEQPRGQIVTPILPLVAQPVGPFGAPSTTRQAESIVTQTQPFVNTQQNTDLIALRDRIQSELDRVNGLIGRSQIVQENAVQKTYSAYTQPGVIVGGQAPVNFQYQGTHAHEVQRNTAVEGNSPIKAYEESLSAGLNHPPVNSNFSESIQPPPMNVFPEAEHRVVYHEQNPRIIRISNQQVRRLSDQPPRVAQSLTNSARHVESPPSSSHNNIVKKQPLNSEPKYDFSGNYQSTANDSSAHKSFNFNEKNVIRIQAKKIQDGENGVRVIYKG